MNKSPEHPLKEPSHVQENLAGAQMRSSFSFDDMEFAALFFSFAVLVGAPLMLITLMIGLLISFE